MFKKLCFIGGTLLASQMSMAQADTARGGTNY